MHQKTFWLPTPSYDLLCTQPYAGWRDPMAMMLYAATTRLTHTPSSDRRTPRSTPTGGLPDLDSILGRHPWIERCAEIGFDDRTTAHLENHLRERQGLAPPMTHSRVADFVRRIAIAISDTRDAVRVAARVSRAWCGVDIVAVTDRRAQPMPVYPMPVYLMPRLSDADAVVGVGADLEVQVTAPADQGAGVAAARIPVARTPILCVPGDSCMK